MKVTSSLILGIVLSLSTSLAFSKTFLDTFESADFSATNTDGFKWGAPNRTSIVIQDPIKGPVAINNGKTINNIHSSVMGDGTTRKWAPRMGLKSLRFNFPAETAMSEQRFNLGTPTKDIWISYWLRVPPNYIHRNIRPNNAKFISLYMDGYADKGEASTVFIGLWANGNNGSNINASWTRTGNTLAGEKTSNVPFISYPSDQGRWMHIVVHLKPETSASANNGEVQGWRKWANETEYTTLFDVANADMPLPTNGSNQGFTAGYLMGSWGPKFPAQTEWLLDDFTISDQPLIKNPGLSAN